MTRHGKPVAESSPYVSRENDPVNPLKGSILYQGDPVSDRREVGQRSVIVLDTRTWIWYATEDPQLSKRARARCDFGRSQNGNRHTNSSFSCPGDGPFLQHNESAGQQCHPQELQNEASKVRVLP